MSWSKDPATGIPTFVPESKAEHVSLVTTSEAQDPENKAKGVSTLGWVSYQEHVRADGHVKRRVDTLVSFKRVPDPVVTDPEDEPEA